MTASAAIRSGGRLPAIQLPELTGAGPIGLQSAGRVATVAVTVHGCCARCADYIHALRAHEQDVRDWDGRVLVIIADDAEPDGSAYPATGAFRTVLDVDARLRRAGATTPAVLIADQWGEIHAVEPAGAEHDFIAPEEVVSWLRYLAIQCPECQGEAL